MTNPIDIDTPASAHVVAERETRTAAEAARKAADAIAEGDVHEARARLNEVEACVEIAHLGLLRGAR